MEDGGAQRQAASAILRPFDFTALVHFSEMSTIPYCIWDPPNPSNCSSHWSFHRHGCTLASWTNSQSTTLTRRNRRAVARILWCVQTGKPCIARMEAWLANPVLMKRDQQAQYAQVIDIDLNELKEPVLALPNDPDASALLSQVQGAKIDEVFIGSCMTNIGHFRAAGKLLAQYNATSAGKPLPTRLWVAPPTKMDEAQLIEEGYYSTFGVSGARTEMPGCSLCMGNQARVAPSSTVISTSTRNFPNRLGQGANVYLGSAELAAIVSIEGELPTVDKYMEYMAQVNATAADTYRYLNFDQLPEFVDKASQVEISDEIRAAAAKMGKMAA